MKYLCLLVIIHDIPVARREPVLQGRLEQLVVVGSLQQELELAVVLFVLELEPHLQLQDLERHLPVAVAVASFCNLTSSLLFQFEGTLALPKIKLIRCYM